MTWMTFLTCAYVQMHSFFSFISCIHSFIHSFIHMCIYIYIDTHTHTYAPILFKRMNSFVQAFVHQRKLVISSTLLCVCVCVYIYVFIYMYIYIYLSPQWLCGNSCTWTHDEPYIMCPSPRVALVFVIGYIYYAHLALPLCVEDHL